MAAPHKQYDYTLKDNYVKNQFFDESSFTDTIQY